MIFVFQGVHNTDLYRGIQRMLGTRAVRVHMSRSSLAARKGLASGARAVPQRVSSWRSGPGAGLRAQPMKNHPWITGLKIAFEVLGAC